MFRKKLNILLLNLVIAVTTVYLQMPKKALAQYYSEGGNKAVVVIDKKISADNGKEYFDNISTQVKTFGEGNQVNFKIDIENKGAETLNDVVLIDNLPKYLNLMVYPGIYNKDNNRIEVKVGQLEVGQRKTYLIMAMIKDLPSANSNNTVWQQTNNACVESDKARDCDDAKYFVGLKTIPTTGSSDLIVQTFVVLSTLTAGMGIRKAVRGY